MYVNEGVQNQSVSYSIPKGIFAILAKILGNERSFLLCALLTGMRTRLKCYLC
ncbi:hypothetical protein SMITH_320 [Smithella sp. ME-1]|uniref:Uncharacterized protein n=1 Tax=hydrocarbon metagenome TaxID=938273 RepID=A0A0W8FRN2_9ZZZZ|nr:hypothetical protein SMITH_320 [Smithella sp. ME-1]